MKKINKTFTNFEIFNIASALLDTDLSDLKLPIKINFYLEKNKKELVALGQELEQERLNIMQKYGTLNEDGTQYKFEEKDVPTVNKEIKEIFDLTQDVAIYAADLDSFGNVDLTSKQLKTISFMIEEEEEEEE